MRSSAEARMTRSARPVQSELFAPVPAALPEGFRYQPELISAAEHDALAAILATLPFQPFDFGGYLANRRVVGYGLRYDYGERRVLETEPIPAFLEPLRQQVATFAGTPAEAFVQVLINEYLPGAGVGWHRDRPQFGEVVGVSLLSPCPFRFRLETGGSLERRTLTVESRSAYLLSGPARRQWQHSVPPVTEHRYSITFRTLAKKKR
jgi:alkylated DNA repair dioxygenase AlkB